MNSASTAPQVVAEERSSKEQHEHVKEIARLLAAGLPLRLAANATGYTEAEVRVWMQADPAIEIAFGAAEAEFQMLCIDAIVKARDKNGNPNVRALMWLMESRFPEQYGRPRSKGQGSRKRAAKKAETEEPIEHASGIGEDPALVQTPALLPVSIAHSPKPGLECGESEACFRHSCKTIAGLQELNPFAAKPTPIRVIPKPGRNTPCPCGSGRKYKHCCGSVSRKQTQRIAA
jgi:hypothetical protein